MSVLLNNRERDQKDEQNSTLVQLAEGCGAGSPGGHGFSKGNTCGAKDGSKSSGGGGRKSEDEIRDSQKRGKRKSINSDGSMDTSKVEEDVNSIESELSDEQMDALQEARDTGNWDALHDSGMFHGADAEILEEHWRQTGGPEQAEPDLLLTPDMMVDEGTGPPREFVPGEQQPLEGYESGEFESTAADAMADGNTTPEQGVEESAFVEETLDSLGDDQWAAVDEGIDTGNWNAAYESMEPDQAAALEVHFEELREKGEIPEAEPDLLLTPDMMVDDPGAQPEQTDDEIIDDLVARSMEGDEQATEMLQQMEAEEQAGVDSEGFSTDTEDRSFNYDEQLAYDAYVEAVESQGGSTETTQFQREWDEMPEDVRAAFQQGDPAVTVDSEGLVQDDRNLGEQGGIPAQQVGIPGYNTPSADIPADLIEPLQQESNPARQAEMIADRIINDPATSGDPIEDLYAQIADIQEARGTSPELASELQTVLDQVAEEEIQFIMEELAEQGDPDADDYNYAAGILEDRIVEARNRRRT